MKIARHVLGIIVMVCVTPQLLFAQFDDETTLDLMASVFLEQVDDSTSSDVASGLIFRNINRIERFESPEMLAEIQSAEKEKDWERLDELLKEYISSFGVKNFEKDAYLLWQAGEVKEILQDTAASIRYYELAIKHSKYRPEYDAWYARFDSLRAPRRSEWLSIEQYYKLRELRKKSDIMIPPKKVLQNMGTKINSVQADYAPFMHPSDSLLIFTSRRAEETLIDDIFSKKNEDLFYAQRSFITGKWEDAQRFDDEINSPLNEGSACLSPDGTTLYFTRCNALNGYGDCDLFQAEYETGRWVRIKNLGKEVNSGYWDSHPNISPDGRVLFFASNRVEGFGGTDIFYTIRDSSGTWLPARNLGPIVNTPQNEVTPFYHKINKTLYFSSTGHIENLGSYDIYKTRWMTYNWEEPDNLGPLVNTQGNEYYFSIDGKGETIFYSRSKDSTLRLSSQNFDLYSFPMPMEARPDAVTTLRGILRDSISGHPLVGMVMVVDIDHGTEIAPKEINRRGYFEFDLIANRNYRIYVLGENFLTIKQDVKLEEEEVFAFLTESLNQNKPVIFESLQFEENSYALRKDVLPKLDYLARFLERYPMFRLEIKGHTDADGSDLYNLQLSQRRAEQIRDYIIERGKFGNERVTAEGFGEKYPIMPNDTEENKKINRRVEFELVLADELATDGPLPSEDELIFKDNDEEFDLDTDEFLDTMDWDEMDGDDFDDWLLDEDDFFDDDDDLLFDDDLFEEEEKDSNDKDENKKNEDL